MSIEVGSEEHKAVCKPEYFCNNRDTVEWEIDWSSEFSISNWMTDFRLECESSRAIGMVGGSYFTGYIISTLITKQVCDGLGRKRAFWLGRAIQAFVYISMALLSTADRSNFWWFYWLLFFMGLQNNINRTAGCNYYCELMPEASQARFIMYMEVLENGGELLIALVFMLTDTDWRTPYSIAAAMIIAFMTLGLVWMPESPHYLFEAERYEECRDAL